MTKENFRQPFYASNARWPRPQQWSYKRRERDVYEDGNCNLLYECTTEDDGVVVVEDDCRDAIDNTLEALAPKYIQRSTASVPPKQKTAEFDRTVLNALDVIRIDDEEHNRLVGCEILLASAQGDYGTLKKILNLHLRDDNDIEHSLKTNWLRKQVILNTLCRTADGKTPLMLSAARGGIYVYMVFPYTCDDDFQLELRLSQ